MRWITGLLTALFLTFAAAAPAQAHAALIASNPAAGALLEAAPTTFVLEFSEDVALVSGNALLLPDGTTLELEGTGGGRRLRVNAPASDQLGTHVLTWRVLSQDGHVISGSLPFAVGEESALVPPRAVDDGGIELRSLLAVLVLVGAVLVVGLAWSRGLAPPSRRRTALLCGAAVTAAGSALGRLLVLRADVGAWVGIEVAAVVLLAAGLVLCVTGAPWGRSWGGFAVLLGLAAVGHSRVTAHPWLSGAADVVHAAAAAVWVGGLVVLALDGRGLEPVDRLSSYRRFARRALAALVVVAVSGTVLSVQILGSWHALVASAHGRLLLLKVGLVIVAVLLGLAHRLALARRAAGDGPTVLSRITRVEAALLVAVLVATGLLGELSPEPARSGPSLVERHVEVGDLVVRVRMAPATVGPNQVEVEVRDGAGAWVPLAAPARLVLRQGERRVGGEMRPVAEGQLLTTVLPGPGRWQLDVSLRLSRFEEPVVSVPVDVSAGATS